MKYSAKLPNKHKIVNPCKSYLMTKILNFKCPRPHPIPMKIAHLQEMHLKWLCPCQIQGNDSWRSIIMLKWFKKDGSLLWSLISTLAVSAGTEWSRTIYWTAGSQLSSSLTCCLKVHAVFQVSAYAIWISVWLTILQNTELQFLLSFHFLLYNFSSQAIQKILQQDDLIHPHLYYFRLLDFSFHTFMSFIICSIMPK